MNADNFVGVEKRALHRWRNDVVAKQHLTALRDLQGNLLGRKNAAVAGLCALAQLGRNAGILTKPEAMLTRKPLLLIVTNI